MGERGGGAATQASVRTCTRRCARPRGRDGPSCGPQEPAVTRSSRDWIVLGPHFPTPLGNPINMYFTPMTHEEPR